MNQCFTFMHYVEKELKVPYRYMKAFNSKYIDEQGEVEERTYSMYVRDLDIESETCLSEEFLVDQHKHSIVLLVKQKCL